MNGRLVLGALANGPKRSMRSRIDHFSGSRTVAMISVPWNRVRAVLRVLSFVLIVQAFAMNSAEPRESPAVTSIERSSSVLIMGVEGATWDRALMWSLSVAIVAAVLVGLAATGSILSHRRVAEAAEQTLGRYAEITAAKIAAAESEGLTAGQAERDRLSAANAQLRADLEREKASRSVNAQNADPAKLPQHASTPARLADEKIAVLTKALRGSFGNVSVDHDGGDVTTAPVSTQLEAAFRDAGWNVSSGIRIGVSGAPKSGLLVRANKSGMTAPQERAVGALKAANIAFDLRLDREPKPYLGGRGHVPAGMGADDLEIVVTTTRH
ncbi:MULTISPECIES: hypothetical protein [unclassified Methylobacterium]|uniref:hypothetical protein n=1 Tax=unclassified Methylobacterium TaxID=2615210 RepID=UPI00226A8C58|nr:MULTISPECIES: hypothetical protein [unclassified Methylobacterium]